MPYLEYHKAYLPAARKNAENFLKANNPKVALNDEKNGWAIGVGASPFRISQPGSHSGPGTGGFTTKLLWDYYEYTQDTTYLADLAYESLYSMSTFLSKTLKPDAGGTLLVEPSASPEIRLKDDKGGYYGDYYITKGTTFDQGFVWETYNDLLKAADILNKEEAFLDVVEEQIEQLDPILIGASGQVKEFREESEYGEFGDPQHRHVSHLCALYPGTLINSKTPQWIEGVKIALDYRGNNTTGWAMAHRMNLRARTKEAEKAHEVYSKFLRERTCPNLWTLHPPFQIDGNLGTMAGVAEMLIQSQEGFIDLLPALPKVWETGSFEGLVARGNFEVSLTWEDGKALAGKVISKKGGRCQLKYEGSERIKVTDEAGKNIAYKRMSETMIEFETMTGEEYQLKF